MKKIEIDEEKIGNEIYTLIKRLYPICRSITGDGNRKTLNIIKEYISLDVHEVPSGTKVFDWTVPKEWNIEDAYIKNSKGEKIIDFQKSNLHIVGYSVQFEGEMTLSELKEHLYTLPDQPDLIPYVTSYYKKIWGFCLSHNDFKQLKDDKYFVKVDTTLKDGSLTYGELIIKGETDKEVLISTYICHPSMANNELSGPVITTFLAKYLLEQKDKPYYTYRIVFIPETIGSVTYLSKYKDKLKDKVVGGYVITCVGNPGGFSYLKTRAENTLTDRITIHVLNNSNKKYKLYDFLSRGSDERQYNSPGIDLPIGSLMRSKYGEYPEYHTSGDNMNFVTSEALAESLEMYIKCLKAIEMNKKYKTTVFCEPQLGKRGLYPTLSKKGNYYYVHDMMNVLAYSDGNHDLLWIAEKLGKTIWELDSIVNKLLQYNLLRIL